MSQEPRTIMARQVFGNTLPFYVVYWNPSDFPGKFVVRRQDVAEGGLIVVADEPLAVADTLLEAREVIPGDHHWMPRHPDDDPVIAECWI